MIKKQFIIICLNLFTTFSLFSQDYTCVVPGERTVFPLANAGMRVRYHSFLFFPSDKKDEISQSFMESLEDKDRPYNPIDKKNSLRLIVNGFPKGYLGLDYERFLHVRQSVGLRSYLYLYKPKIFIYIPLTYKEMAIFKGIKLAPYYRYYFWRNNHNGGYAEAALLLGYFNFEEINYFKIPYDDPDDTGDFSGISNSIGLEGSFGWMFQFRRIPLVINLSLGMQYFRLNVPKYKYKQVNFPGGFTERYEVDDWFWYFGGPGSIFEFKFMFGGIF